MRVNWGFLQGSASYKDKSTSPKRVQNDTAEAKGATCHPLEWQVAPFKSQIMYYIYKQG